MTNRKLKYIFEMTYDHSIKKLEEYLKYDIKRLLLVLNDVSACINSNVGYSISIRSNDK